VFRDQQSIIPSLGDIGLTLTDSGQFAGGAGDTGRQVRALAESGEEVLFLGTAVELALG
jgi:hypothetical protein